MTDIVMTNTFLILYIAAGISSGIFCVKHEMDDGMEDATALLGMMFLMMLFFWPILVIPFGLFWLVGKAITFLVNTIDRWNR